MSGFSPECHAKRGHSVSAPPRPLCAGSPTMEDGAIGILLASPVLQDRTLGRVHQGESVDNHHGRCWGRPGDVCAQSSGQRPCHWGTPDRLVRDYAASNSHHLHGPLMAVTLKEHLLCAFCHAPPCRCCAFWALQRPSRAVASSWRPHGPACLSIADY